MINLSLAPRAATPRAFLLLAMLWGILAGLGLAVAGPAALHSRWAVETLALTHVCTLGLLGNAMLGALLQFLPAAAAVALPRWTAVALLPGLNVGLLALLLHFLSGSPMAGKLAAALLAGGLGLPVLSTLLRAGRARAAMLGRGLQFALLLLLLTLWLGLWLLGTRVGALHGPRPLLIDMHAALGLFGWVLGLLLCVASLTLPMLQGTRRLPAISVPLGCGLIGVSLLSALGLRGLESPAWPIALGLPLLLGCALYVWLLATLAQRRNRPLRGFWLMGLVVLAAACLLWILGPDPIPFGARPASGLVAATLALGWGLPLLVCGMALEILAFLTWIDLHRGSHRGQRVPGVHALLSDRAKWGVLMAQSVAGALLLPAVFAPQQWASIAGLALAAAYALTLWVGLAPGHHARRYLDFGGTPA